MRRLALLATILSAACSNDDVAPDPFEFEHSDTSPLSACADKSANDAVTLALRDQTGIPLAQGLVDDYAWLLESARAAHPAMCDISARVDYAPTDILVTTENERVIDAWRKGRKRTGVSELDRVLQPFGLADITDESRDNFMLIVEEPVNAQRLAEELTATNAVRAFANWMIYTDGTSCEDVNGVMVCTDHGPSNIVFTRDQGATTIRFTRANSAGQYTVMVAHDATVGDLVDVTP